MKINASVWIPDYNEKPLSPLKKWLYRNIGRKLMNRNVERIRS